MKQYVVKGNGEFRTIVEVLQKDRRGYTVKMKKERSWGYKEEVCTMSEKLFDSCIRTGYLSALHVEKVVRSA